MTGALIAVAVLAAGAVAGGLAPRAFWGSRRRKAGAGGAWGPGLELLEIFARGQRHARLERLRQESQRDDDANGDEGPDGETRVVRVRRGAGPEVTFRVRALRKGR